MNKKVNNPAARATTGSDNFSVIYTQNSVSQVVLLGKNEDITQEIFEFGVNNDNLQPSPSYFVFASSLPQASSGTPGGGGGSTGGGTGGGSTGGSSPRPGGGPADCPYWVLSWCFYPASPFPTYRPASPLPTILPSALASPFIKPTPKVLIPDCNLWNQMISGKAVISQTVCVKKEDQ